MGLKIGDKVIALRKPQGGDELLVGILKTYFPNGSFSLEAPHLIIEPRASAAHRSIAIEVRDDLVYGISSTSACDFFKYNDPELLEKMWDFGYKNNEIQLIQNRVNKILD